MVANKRQSLALIIEVISKVAYFPETPEGLLAWLFSYVLSQKNTFHFPKEKLCLLINDSEFKQTGGVNGFQWRNAVRLMQVKYGMCVEKTTHYFPSFYWTLLSSVAPHVCVCVCYPQLFKMFLLAF